MMIPFEFAMYLCAIAALGGFFAGGAFNSALRSWRRDSRDIAGPAPTNHAISHVAPQNFRELTPTLREKLRQTMPAYREMEDITEKNQRDAAQARRALGDPARPTPIMAGLSALRGEDVAS